MTQCRYDDYLDEFKDIILLEKDEAKEKLVALRLKAYKNEDKGLNYRQIDMIMSRCTNFINDNWAKPARKIV